MSKILYLSCHEILEYDEVKLFHELGHEVFSPGAYVEPRNRGDDSLRPGIEGLEYNPDMVEMWNRHEAIFPEVNGKEYLDRSVDILNYFDHVVVMHYPTFIAKNWNVFKPFIESGKRVTWRTIGQSVISTEQQMTPYRNMGMEIVRYSPMEEQTPHFCGSDALIRFYKDPEEYGDWRGDNNRVITFAQSMKQRGAACSYDMFEAVTRPFPRHLYGPGNEGQDWTSGKIPYDQLKEEMRANRCYFYTGTHPASYTLNFMEAWMTGIPIVAIGPQWGNGKNFPGCSLYEVHRLIENGVNGFVDDDPSRLQARVRDLLSDHSLATRIGEAGRAEAIRHFGKDLIKESWRAYLGDA